MTRPTTICSALIVASLTYAHGNLQQNAANKGHAVVCKLQNVFDTQSHTDAFTYFVPKGWTADYDLKWFPAQPGAFQIKLSASTPDGQYQVTRMGQQVYNFIYNHSIAGGPEYHLRTPIHHAADYLRVALDQIAQKQGFQGIEVVDEVNVPIALEKVPLWIKNAPVPAWETRVPAYETGFLQVKFTQGEHSMTAMLGTTVMGYSSTSVLPGKNVVAGEGGFFTVGPTTILISPADASVDRKKEMKIIAGSFRMTGQFRAYLADLTDHLIRIKLGAAAAGQRYHDATFHEHSMGQFEEQMHLRDAYSHEFCNYISDQQDYRDQKGHIVTAPANFRYAWSDGSGNYLLNDDPTLDMRGFGNGNWKQMEKARIGQ